MSLDKVDRYRRGRYGGYGDVKGWFWPEDFRIFYAIMDAQITDGIEGGDMLEIGCYHGKSAILMGYGLRESEQLIICDLFGAPCEDTAEVTDHFEASFTRQTFADNYAKFHQQKPVIFGESSLGLPDLIADRRLRFSHVDGGHAQLVASFDIGTAVDNTVDMGVIAIDDYRTHHTPGVAAAIWASACERQIWPFALSENKVYAAATQQGHGYWLAVMQNLNWPGGEVHKIFGSDVLRLTQGRLCG